MSDTPPTEHTPTVDDLPPTDNLPPTGDTPIDDEQVPEESVPLCLSCLRPVDPLDHYCPHCGRCTGQLTPNIPLVSIPYQVEFWGGAWRKLWNKERSSIPVRVLSAVLITLMAPFMFIGAPFIRSARRDQPGGHGPENRPAPAAGPPPPPDQSPLYKDRPLGPNPPPQPSPSLPQE